MVTAGVIIETEAYAGIDDRASHAFGGRKTKRTKTMYERGGISYVYLCYGIHPLFNIVTNTEGIPDAILIRAIEPFLGIEEICRRRNQTKVSAQICSGPGKVTQALGIGMKDNGISLTGNRIWLEDSGIEPNDAELLIGPRVGVGYAGEDALRSYRFLFRR